MKFSVIITVYNTSSEYLYECIDSVLNQEYSNIEIVVIDDGSTDEETINVLKQYKSKAGLHNKNLMTKRKANGGQGSARNAGLALASGDYVLFLDSDDYYMSTGLFDDIARLLSESRADVLSFQYEEFFNNNKRPQVTNGTLSRGRIFGQSRDKAIKALLSAPRSVFSSVTHTKAIKLSLLRDNNITALEGYSNEDISLTAAVIHHAQTYDRYNKVIYAYRRANIHSISTKSENSFKIACDVLYQIQSLLSNKSYRSDKNILDFLASPYVYWLSKIVAASAQIDNSYKEEYTQCINAGAAYSYVLKYSSRLYIRLFGVFLRLSGIKLTMFLLRVFLTLNKKHMLSLRRKAG
jgi:glycosyltransferase involved in cell wall biosynthesis